MSKLQCPAFPLFCFLKLSHRSRVQPLDPDEIHRIVQLALAEDIGAGDVTTIATVPESAISSAAMHAREPLRVAGLALAEAAFQQLAPGAKIENMATDGESVDSGQILMRISGPARAILTAERVALNFVQRLSGIATLTSAFVRAIHGTAAQILDTRKTTPGWRKLEKYAVTCGGGRNHRFGLFDMVLIKDNHLAALRDARPNAVAAAIQQARARYPQLKVEIEADTLEQVQQALAAGADLILLDNMPVPQLRTRGCNCAGAGRKPKRAAA